MVPDLSFPSIKVCGVTRLSDLETLAAAGVGAVGLNLVPTSRRSVPLAQAALLAARAQQLNICSVAVLRDPTPDTLQQVVRAHDWDYLQLHGREHPGLVEHCRETPIVKAVSWSGRSEEENLVLQWTTWDNERASRIESSTSTRPAGCRLAGFLIDAYAPTEGGGTGRVADWQLLWPRPPALEGWPLILAGGLNAENVAEAIRQTRCNSVDTASGVEHSPGIKSGEAVMEFAQHAREGFSAVHR